MVLKRQYVKLLALILSIPTTLLSSLHFSDDGIILYFKKFEFINCSADDQLLQAVITARTCFNHEQFLKPKIFLMKPYDMTGHLHINLQKLIDIFPNITTVHFDYTNIDEWLVRRHYNLNVKPWLSIPLFNTIRLDYSQNNSRVIKLFNKNRDEFIIIDD